MKHSLFLLDSGMIPADVVIVIDRLDAGCALPSCSLLFLLHPIILSALLDTICRHHPVRYFIDNRRNDSDSIMSKTKNNNKKIRSFKLRQYFLVVHHARPSAHDGAPSGFPQSSHFLPSVGAPGCTFASALYGRGGCSLPSQRPVRWCYH